MPPSSRQRTSPAACTIITRCYLSHARILAESYHRHEPGGQFYIIIVDGLPDGVEFGFDVRIITLEELQLPYLNELLFKYDLVEFCTAIKPTFLTMLMTRFGEEQVLYIDPDIMLARPLDEVATALKTSGIVLTPHLLRPQALDGQHPSDQDILMAGAYNLGFIGLSKTTQTMDFLRWWEERLREHCRIDPATGLMTDQKWIDLVPGLFSSTTILRDETYNVAYWNINARRIIRCEEQFLVNARPLAFFHFSNFDPTHPLALSRDHGRGNIIKGTGLADLLELYATLQFQNGYRTSIGWKYQRATLDNGIAISTPLRHLYLHLSPAARAPFADPFQTTNANSFFKWATTPRSDRSDLSPFLMGIYKSRMDLQAAFPDIAGSHRNAFVNWAQTTGPREMGYDPRLAAYETSESPATVYEHPLEYLQLVDQIKQVVRRSLPADAVVAVISKGDPQLLQLDGRVTRHFPQSENGHYAGHYPSDGPAAVSHLLNQIEQGTTYLLVPDTSLWWLDHYTELRDYLEQHGKLLTQQPGVCRIFAVGSAVKVKQDTPEQRTDRMLQERARQVADLTAENLRLRTRLRDLEMLWKLPSTDKSTVKVFWRVNQQPAPNPVEIKHPRLISIGDLRWLSHDASGRVISIILPAVSDPDALRGLLNTLSTQSSHSSIDVIGFVAGSSDSTLPILLDFGATVIGTTAGHSTSNTARDFAASQARGTTLIVLDDARPPIDDQWLTRLCASVDQTPHIASITSTGGR